jgi:hypothetical protein
VSAPQDRWWNANDLASPRTINSPVLEQALQGLRELAGRE